MQRQAGATAASGNKHNPTEGDMRKIPLSIGALGTLLAVVLGAAPGYAANVRSWVSASGSGTACTQSAPCANFATALAATASGGQINCLTPGEYGNGSTLTITQSVTINCYGVLAGITAPSGSPAISINGSGIQVFLLHLVIDGNGEGTEGIFITNAADVAMHNLLIKGFTGQGVLNESSSEIALLIRDSVIGANGGTAVALAGASGSGALLLNDSIGVSKYGVALTSGNGVTVNNSQIIGNSTGGIYAADGSGMYVVNSSITSNPIGIENAGTSLISVDSSDIQTNGTGVSGSWYSYGNNRLVGNTSNGTAPTEVTTE
jgi:hypothetical protein